MSQSWYVFNQPKYFTGDGVRCNLGGEQNSLRSSAMSVNKPQQST
jgi:hypothetical protein